VTQPGGPRASRLLRVGHGRHAAHNLAYLPIPPIPMDRVWRDLHCQRASPWRRDVRRAGRGPLAGPCHDRGDEKADRTCVAIDLFLLSLTCRFARRGGKYSDAPVRQQDFGKLAAFFFPEGESGCVLGIQGDTGRDGEAVTKFWGSGQSGRFGLHGRAGFSPVHRDDLGGSAAVVEFDVSMGGAVFVDAFGDLDVVCAISGDLEERLVIAG